MKPLLVFQYLFLCLSQLPWLSLESSEQITYTCPRPHYFHSLHNCRSTFTHLAAACAKQCHRSQRRSTASWAPLMRNWWQLLQNSLLILQEIQKGGKAQKKKQYSRPGFQEGWVFTVDTSEGSFKSPGADQLWAAEAAPLLLQHIREMERNGVQNSSPWHINPPK